MESFFDFFKYEYNKDKTRAKFLSRLFGIFSEEIVRIWVTSSNSEYINLGRPTLKYQGDKSYTLDFTFQHKQNKKCYVVEMKCEIEYQDFRNLVLSDTNFDRLIQNHKKPAFEYFLKAAQYPHSIQTTVNKKLIDIDGSILIWGAYTPEGKWAAISKYGFYDVLSVEEICRSLTNEQNKDYLNLLNNRNYWCNDLFTYLKGKTND